MKILRKVTPDDIYNALVEDFGIVNAQGSIVFKLKDFGITVKQNSVVGNILEDWLAEWITSKGFASIHNEQQTAPDFWLDPDDLSKNLLEVKCFTKSPNFDIANFISYINEIVDRPYRLASKYLLIKYNMDEEGIVKIENIWLKNVWEICSSSGNRPIKVQEKKKVIYNIRPTVWYSDNRTAYPPFQSLEHFLSALEQTLYDYNQTRSTVAEGWAKKVCKAYKEYFGKELNLPRWYDIKDKYISNKE